MNKTEFVARRWLSIEHNVDIFSVVFNPSRTPDFILPDGTEYEVKRLYRDKIILYPAQIETLSKRRDINILVFADGSSSPVAAINAGSLVDTLNEGKDSIFNIKIVCMGGKYLITLPESIDARYRKYHSSLMYEECGQQLHSMFFTAAMDKYLESKSF